MLSRVARITSTVEAGLALFAGATAALSAIFFSSLGSIKAQLPSRVAISSPISDLGQSARCQLGPSAARFTSGLASPMPAKKAAQDGSTEAGLAAHCA